MGNTLLLLKKVTKINRRQLTVFLNLCVTAAATAKPLIKKKEAKCHKDRSLVACYFSFCEVNRKRSMEWVASFATTSAHRGMEDQPEWGEKVTKNSKCFEQCAKNNFPHVACPIKTTKAPQYFFPPNPTISIKPNIPLWRMSRTASIHCGMVQGRRGCFLIKS